MENKLTKHNTENSNNVQHEPHCLKPWVNSLTTWVLSSGVRVVHYLSFLCCVLFNFFSMLSVSSPKALSSGVRVVHYLELTDNMEKKLNKTQRRKLK
jgi:hypothetical protein